MDRTRAGLDDETLDVVLKTLKTVSERRLDKASRLALDDSGEFPLALVNELLGPELGLHLLFLPEEVGGLGGGGRDLFRVSEEMARVDLGVATAFLAIALGVDPIIVGGTPEQKRHWLGRIAEEGLIVAYGVTEPEAGSNVANLRTVAEPLLGADGAVRAYRIDGTKQFITNGGVAQVYTVLARAPRGPSFFVVERGAPGFSVGAPEHKHGIRASNTTQIVLEGVEVPADHLLGLEEGRGLEQANEVFGFTRLMVAAFGLGAGEEALRRSVRYGLERIQFGEPLYRKQGFTHKLIVPHAVRLEAARALCEEVASRLDAGEPGLQVEGAVAKLFATEAGNAAADAAIQAHGGYGYTHEYEVEKIRRDVRITTIYEGTSEIQQSIIGTHRWRMVVKTRGGFYHDQARSLRELGTGEAAALAADALAETFLACHAQKLPREQWAMFELARLAAEVETAVALARKAARDAGPRRELLMACARLHGSAAAREVAVTGLRLLLASGRYGRAEVAAFRERIRFDELLAAAEGELERMSIVAELLAAESA
ncbi:MAG: acyl-CoA dehydrogenase family protein [Thermoanaerobaculales bacterium]|jgi:alkylation response protein AidB-like acyl-CoA dehydrogenase|nr:acyl-CoA dehydrogenase family protein [Thermoanaerobaculales bacterium]